MIPQYLLHPGESSSFYDTLITPDLFCFAVLQGVFHEAFAYWPERLQATNR